MGILDAFNIIVKWVDKTWDACGIQILLLGSLGIQLVLNFLGNRRKYSPKIWMEIIVWFAYVLANWVAGFSLTKLLGVQRISTREKVLPDDALRALWAPLLLSHLGGPDSITANSLEDSQLWWRHLLGLVVQVVMAFYTVIKSWNNSLMSFLTIPMFIAGVIKYGERTCALKTAYSDPRGTFSHSNSKSSTTGTGSTDTQGQGVGKHIRDDQTALLVRSYHSFKKFYPYVANQVGYIQLDPFEEENAKVVLVLIENELRFIYDVLYTKFYIIVTKYGAILRSTSVFCTFFVLIGFSIVNKKGCGTADVIVTYILLIAAVLLEVYAIGAMIISDWVACLMIDHKWCLSPIQSFIKWLTSIFVKKKDALQRLSHSCCRLNLFSYCLLLENTNLLMKVLQWSMFRVEIIEFWCLEYKDIPSGLKDYIVWTIKQQSPQDIDRKFNKSMKFEASNLLDYDSQTSEDLDQNIITWHIVTDICYYSFSEPSGSQPVFYVLRENCKLLSDYMMYLLVLHPYMLRVTPARSKEIIKDIAEEIHESERLKDKLKCMLPVRKGGWWRKLGSQGASELEGEGNDNPHLAEDLLEALAADAEENSLRSSQSSSSKDKEIEKNKQLRKEGMNTLKRAIIQAQTLMGQPDRWDIISSMWVEMLCYGAAQCQMIHHCQQLRRGGELLTHIWLFMAHKTLTQEEEQNDGLSVGRAT